MGILKHAGDHMHMMGEMMRQTDTDVTLTGGPSGDAFLRGAVVHCLFCKHGEGCRSWLEEGHEHSEPPAFCRNATRFATCHKSA